MSAAGSWPRWSLEGEPAALAKYVLPDEVAALLQLPGPPADSPIGQTEAVYEALAGAAITYSHEAPSDEPGRQVVRQPGEVLWCPRHATCLDLALILAGACLHAGLRPLVLILDPPESGRAAHALLGVWIDEVTDDEGDGVSVPDAEVWSSRPADFDDLVQIDPTGPSRPLLLLDPVGAAHALPHSPVLGAGVAFADAVAAGARYAREWHWRLAVDIGRAWRKQDTHTPAERPADEPLRSPYVPLDAQVHRPLQVLRAEHAVVPFQARDELTILTDWCHTVAAGAHTGVTVVHGTGGAGKTRLALELAHQLATRHGWYTGYLREHPTGRDWLGTVVSPTLIVLDYADARTADAEHLLAVLRRRTDRGAAPAVVVMTARAVSGQWLTALRTAWTRDGHLVRESPPLHLPPEHPAGAALFRRAARAFHDGPGHELDLAAADRAAPADWTTLDHILLALLAARSPGRLPTTHQDLYEEVLTHERTYWAQTYRRNAHLGRDADVPLDVLNRAVAGLTLHAPTTRKEIHAALRAVEELSDDASWRETIRTTLTTCLQPGPGEPLVLRPDPIADHLTLHELRDDEDLLPAVLDGLDGDRLVTALRQLNRAAAAEPDSATRMVKAWISAGADRWLPVLDVAAEQGGTALAALEQLIADEPVVPWLDDLSGTIPFTTIGLADLALRADLRRLSLMRAEDTVQPVDLADQLQRVSQRQGTTGDQQAALVSITEAVGIRRTLAQTDPALHLSDLAGALNNLSNHQSETGKHEAALLSITEAVTHSRALAQTDPAAHLPDLAGALNNLAIQQSANGNRQAALASVTEAVGHYRTFAQANPAAHYPGFAGALSNLSNRQSETGDWQAALDSATEAVEIRRTLAQANPALHLPGFASDLNNLSNHQSGTGDREAALASITEATAHYRTLAQTSPAVHLPGLAGALNNLAIQQSGTGEHEAALASITEATAHYRTLAQTSPAVHLPNLASALNNLAIQQNANGDWQAALDSATQAVEIRRTLAQANPAAHLPGFASALNNLSNHQSETGKHEAALASVTEAVGHYRTLAQATPAAHLPDLAGTLNNLSLQQNANGDRQAALDSATEAVGHYRTLAQATPAAHLPHLASALNNLSVQLRANGDRQAALDSVTEAVGHYRTLAQATPAAHLPDLAGTLNNLSVQLRANGDRQAALDSATEAVGHYRTLAQATPAAHLPDLAGTLNNLSNHQSGTGEREAALASITEAVGHYRALAQASPSVHVSGLAGALNNLSLHLRANGDRQAALDAAAEAVEIRRTLAQANPAAHLPHLAGSLNNLAIQQNANGDRQAALDSVTEAVGHYRTLARAAPAAHLPDLAGALNNLAIQQNANGDRQAALISVTEAVGHYRTLARAAPAAHLPGLAGALNNHSLQQYESGDRSTALASITEAVGHYRALAQTSPAAHLTGLAGALNNLSKQQSETEAASSAWEGALTDLGVAPLAQAELRSHYAAYLAATDQRSLAVEQLVQAAQACAAGGRSPLSRARQQVRGTAMDLAVQDPRLPDWAVAPLPDDVLELLGSWGRTGDWPSTEAFLHAHADRLRQPDFRSGLDLAAVLFPESPAIDSLAHVLDQVDTEGLDTVLSRGRHDHEVRQTLTEWVATSTWAQSKEFLDEHAVTLSTPEVWALLAGSDTQGARQHLAILQLTEALSSDRIYEIVTDPDIATEHAFAALDVADVPLMRRILAACPALLTGITGITGAFFATVAATADGDTEVADRLSRAIAEQGTDTQRHAYAIRLRALAGPPSALAGAGELADLIHPGKLP
ncbi:hypothetical protein [Streptomyces tendae]|uniref:hypothetical protein n=1 Tax=Streptomyces tendae TaxID=1932 RepID=UPI003D7474E8